MIEGLKFKFSGKEITNQLASRVKHHYDREIAYQKALKLIPEEDIKDDKSSNYSQSLTLKQQIKSHKHTAEKFEVMLSHISYEEEYLLGEYDLRLMEFFQ
jgi:hypothetical protein